MSKVYVGVNHRAGGSLAREQVQEDGHEVRGRGRSLWAGLTGALIDALAGAA